MNLRPIAGCTLALLLCSCTGTSLKQTWKSPDYPGGTKTRLAVVAVDERTDVRKAVESRLVRQLRQAGASAAPTYDRFSLAQMNQDKAAAAQRLQADGTEAVVIIRLRDLASFYRESRPGPERYAEVITGYEMGPWYDYFTVAYMDMNVTYGNLKQKLYLETSIFDLKTATRLWSGLTQTVLTETMDPLPQMDKIAAKVVAAMQKDGLIP